MPRTNHPWVCCQLGSREHYAIPRVLHKQGRLKLLLTDFWAREPTALNAFVPAALARVAERRHPGLAGARILQWGTGRIAFDMRTRQLSSWEQTLRRNERFQQVLLRRLRPHRKALAAEPGTFFAYSYAARELLRFFSELGWRTVLGQIDPGPREEEIVAAEVRANPPRDTRWTPAPPLYWEHWREEIALAHRVIVNSPWSREALVEKGVNAQKIDVVPLAYEAPAEPAGEKSLPEAFTAERPLRVLYLGQINIRKGAHRLMEAMRCLAGKPVELHLVGPADITLPESSELPRVKVHGPVSRQQAVRHYREADVFILPTLSDGFALTQLEAQAHRLPLITSARCGAVVRPGENGLLAEPPTRDNLIEALESCLAEPARLAEWSRASGIDGQFSLAALSRTLGSY